MPYDYQQERQKILTDEGQKALLRMNREATQLLDVRPVFWLEELLRKASLPGDAWFQLALVDRLVELGQFREVKRVLRFYTSFAEPKEPEPLFEFFGIQATHPGAVVSDIEEIRKSVRRRKRTA